MGSEKIEKIDTKKSKAAAPSPAESKKVSEKDVLAIMQKLAKNGIVEVTSRLISDKLGLEPDAGRQKVRTLMKKLEKVGKVVIECKAVKGKREQYIYKLKERK